MGVLEKEIAASSALSRAMTEGLDSRPRFAELAKKPGALCWKNESMLRLTKVTIEYPICSSDDADDGAKGGASRAKVGACVLSHRIVVHGNLIESSTQHRCFVAYGDFVFLSVIQSQLTNYPRTRSVPLQ